jgi:hypothetical protein
MKYNRKVVWYLLNRWQQVPGSYRHYAVSGEWFISTWRKYGWTLKSVRICWSGTGYVRMWLWPIVQLLSGKYTSSYEHVLTIFSSPEVCIHFLKHPVFKKKLRNCSNKRLYKILNEKGIFLRSSLNTFNVIYKWEIHKYCTWVHIL